MIRDSLLHALTVSKTGKKLVKSIEDKIFYKVILFEKLPAKISSAADNMYELYSLIYSEDRMMRVKNFKHICVDMIKAEIKSDEFDDEIIIGVKDDYTLSYDDMMKKFGEAYLNEGKFVFVLIGCLKDEDQEYDFIPAEFSHRALFVDSERCKVKLCKGMYRLF